MEQGLNHKVFTETEYQDIIGTMSEVDFQKEQVQYLRGRVEKQDQVLKKLVDQVSERNYIEAKEKGFRQSNILGLKSRHFLKSLVLNTISNPRQY